MRGELLRELERERMAHLERRRVVHDARLFADRRGDLFAAMAGVHAPESGRAVKNLSAVGGGVVHILRGDEQARRALEGAVRREGHPELFERRSVAELGRAGGALSVSVAMGLYREDESADVAAASRTTPPARMSRYVHINM